MPNFYILENPQKESEGTCKKSHNSSFLRLRVASKNWSFTGLLDPCLESHSKKAIHQKTRGIAAAEVGRLVRCWAIDGLSKVDLLWFKASNPKPGLDPSCLESHSARKQSIQKTRGIAMATISTLLKLSEGWSTCKKQGQPAALQALLLPRQLADHAKRSAVGLQRMPGSRPAIPKPGLPPTAAPARVEPWLWQRGLSQKRFPP